MKELMGKFKLVYRSDTNQYAIVRPSKGGFKIVMITSWIDTNMVILLPSNRYVYTKIEMPDQKAALAYLRCYLADEELLNKLYKLRNGVLYASAPEMWKVIE